MNGEWVLPRLLLLLFLLVFLQGTRRIRFLSKMSREEKEDW